MSALKPEARPWNWRFVLLTSGAGLLTFAGTGFLTLVLREASVGGPPATEGANVVRPPTPSQQGSAPNALLHAATAPVAAAISAVPTAEERLRGSITHDPFAALQGTTPPVPVPAASAPALKPAGPAKPAVTPVVLPPLPPPPPQPPMAPPLPFVAVGAIQGMQVNDGQRVAFIRQQDQLIVVRAGDAIGQNYKVESISAQAIELTYLPLMQRQRLTLAP